jgi:hypothetical protein
LNVITPAVQDLERSLALYRDGLGLATKGVLAADLQDRVSGRWSPGVLRVRRRSHPLRAAKQAGLINNGPHILHHTFCSHLAMRNAQNFAETFWQRGRLGSKSRAARTRSMVPEEGIEIYSE